MTIDPDDAKDFDDAICLRRDGAAQWKLWVHIADVSHYVRPGGALDEEARRRGNSTYLVDRVIPMLPEALSNEICSLKPGVDRLTKCVEFLLSNEGRVLNAKFYPAVIRSKRRFTYKEVLAVLQRPRSGDPIEQMLQRRPRVGAAPPPRAVSRRLAGAGFSGNDRPSWLPKARLEGPAGAASAGSRWRCDATWQRGNG